MNNLKRLIALICILKIFETKAELCFELSLVFKYSEIVPGQPFWEPLLESDRNPQLTAFFDDNKHCALELDCVTSTNLTGIVTFQDDPEPDPEGSGSDGMMEDGPDTGTYLECNQIYKNNTAIPVKIQVIPESQCDNDCYDIIWESDLCNDEDDCKAGIVDVEPETTDIDPSIEGKDLTALYVIAGILGCIACSALLFFAIKTAVAYFKSASYHVGDTEANRNQGTDESVDKFD